jgi:hypothetical protein
MSDSRFHVVRSGPSDAPQAVNPTGMLPPRSHQQNPQQQSVVVNAGETLALLMHAARRDRAWISDFADETMLISRDLYEVLLHYKQVVQQERSRAA